MAILGAACSIARHCSSVGRNTFGPATANCIWNQRFTWSRTDILSGFGRYCCAAGDISVL